MRDLAISRTGELAGLRRVVREAVAAGAAPHVDSSVGGAIASYIAGRLRGKRIRDAIAAALEMKADTLYTPVDRAGLTPALVDRTTEFVLSALRDDVKTLVEDAVSQLMRRIGKW